ncbi:MAG: type III pantothenate kinase [Gammaproteobacteria bacterium]|nr:type III pantothenate kinase [Gammaproteobacteria bacterium]
MNLLIDIGNSRIKWATLESGSFMTGGAVPRPDAMVSDGLFKVFADLSRPKTVLVANVGGQAAAENVAADCSRLWSLSPVFVQVERQRFGVINGYTDFRQLGVDRWLALLAAWSERHRPACIVSCGTATTIDGLDREGQHVGGLIVPGVDLMLRSLSDNTDGIPPAASSGAMPEFGRSTGECVRNGAAIALAALIDRAAAWMTSRHGPDLHCFITGGAAERLLPGLQHRFEHDPELVLRGLALFGAER